MWRTAVVVLALCLAPPVLAECSKGIKQLAAPGADSHLAVQLEDFMQLGQTELTTVFIGEDVSEVCVERIELAKTKFNMVTYNLPLRSPSPVKSKEACRAMITEECSASGSIGPAPVSSEVRPATVQDIGLQKAYPPWCVGLCSNGKTQVRIRRWDAKR